MWYIWKKLKVIKLNLLKGIIMGIEKIKFKYKFDSAYNPSFITGVHGGITPKNPINMSFCYERQPFPTSITNEIDQTGLVGKEIERTPREIEGVLDVVRFIETGISMDIHSAIEIRDWLSSQIDLLSKIKKDSAKD